MDVNVLKEIGKLDKKILTSFLDWYKKEYSVPQLSEFVVLDFSMQLGVLLRYLDKVHYVVVLADRVGNTVVYIDKKRQVSSIHDYAEGGLMSNYAMGIIRAIIKIKEKK